MADKSSGIRHPQNVVSQRVLPLKKCWERQTNQPRHVCRLSYLGQKVTFSAGERFLSFGRDSWKKNPPTHLPPFPARSSLHRSLDPCAWSWRQNRREGGGGNIGEGGIGAWWAIYWKHFLKVSSWMVSVSLYELGKKHRLVSLISPNFQRIFREKMLGNHQISIKKLVKLEPWLGRHGWKSPIFQPSNQRLVVFLGFQVVRSPV